MHTDGKTLSFDLPITADSQPNVTVDALLHQGQHALPGHEDAEGASGAAAVAGADHVRRKMSSSRSRVPTYDVVTRDFAGKPVSADLSFGVVDEAIYSLYPDSSGDMVQRSTRSARSNRQVDSSLNYYFSGEAGTKSPMLAMRDARYRPQLAQVKPGNEAKPRVRKAFPDTAFWAPHVHTDASRPRPRLAHLPRLADHMASHGARHHAGLEGGLRDQPRAGAQERTGAYGHAALPAARATRSRFR